MNKKILIVEDEFMIANDLKMMLMRSGYSITGIAASVQQAQQLIAREKPDWVLLDIFLKGKETGLVLGQQLAQQQIPFLYISANSNESILDEAKTTQPYGFLVKPFREKDILVTLDLARYRHQNSLETKLKLESVIQANLMKLIVESNKWETRLLDVIKELQPLLPFDYVATGIGRANEKMSIDISYSRIGYDEYQVIGTKEFLTMTGQHQSQNAAMRSYLAIYKTGESYNEREFQRVCSNDPLQKLLAKTFRLTANLMFPVVTGDAKLVFFSFYSRQSNAYNTDHLAALNRLYPTLSLLSNGIKPEENETAVLTERTSHSNQLANHKTGEPAFNGIIGNSTVLQNVLSHVMQVAQSDTTILILGESGTGKELVARAIHDASPREGKLLVKVNCAALPANLIESELFGHEKGAFTGAINKRVGKFELASGGTLFLDEIGEMPLDLQVKLLRALQEKEIERVGGNLPIKINTRIIAATNRNLLVEVQEGRFRLDLYYRLNVFPIVVPPLRNRKEDIPDLAYHFIDCYARKAGKKITGISDSALLGLMNYDWPGNIREMEHLIERSVILTTESIIKEIPLPNLTDAQPQSSEEQRIKSLDEHERDYILSVLKKCNGKVWGTGGAAEQLNIPSSTLYSKLDRLGIKRKYAI